jgi:ribosomal protein L40E
MAKKRLGYVELEWTCSNCGSRNPGPQKMCSNCGSPQPEDVEFEQKASEALLEDEEKLAQAKAGPDIHCYYCGTRNPATAKTCSQCGAALAEGERRKSGQVLGAHRTGPAEPLLCPNCSAENNPNEDICANCGAALPRPKARPEPAAAPKPARKGGIPGKVIGIGVAVVVALLCGVLIFFFNRTEEVSGRVERIEWQRDIEIEGLVAVEYDDWRSDIPNDAVVGRCTLRVHHSQDDPPARDQSKEICGTPFTVDSGSGFGEVVQECRYEVYQEWCDYTVEEWRQVDTVTLTGDDFNPQWPQFTPGPNQREGGRAETYRCYFATEQGQRAYATSNFSRYQDCEIGSRWNLDVNSFNVVLDIEPGN